MQARLYGYACKRLGDISQADDFVQKVFLKMQVNFARMIAREPVEAWIFTVARNEIVDWYRERAKSDVSAEAELLDRGQLAHGAAGAEIAQAVLHVRTGALHRIQIGRVSRQPG